VRIRCARHHREERDKNARRITARTRYQFGPPDLIRDRFQQARKPISFCNNGGKPRAGACRTACTLPHPSAEKSALKSITLIPPLQQNGTANSNATPCGRARKANSMPREFSDPTSGSTNSRLASGEELPTQANTSDAFLTGVLSRGETAKLDQRMFRRRFLQLTPLHRNNRSPPKNRDFRSFHDFFRILRDDPL